MFETGTYYVKCQTQVDAVGTGLVFNVTIGGVSGILGTDILNYVTAAPTVTAVTGCVPDASVIGGTTNCPTYVFIALLLRSLCCTPLSVDCVIWWLAGWVTYRS